MRSVIDMRAARHRIRSKAGLWLFLWRDTANATITKIGTTVTNSFFCSGDMTGMLRRVTVRYVCIAMMSRTTIGGAMIARRCGVIPGATMAVGAAGRRWASRLVYTRDTRDGAVLCGKYMLYILDMHVVMTRVQGPRPK